jgi:hypothetical protein
VFLHSFSELTELPFALLIGLTFLAYQSRQWLAMSMLAGLSPLGRPEGFGFVVLAAAALVAHRRWWWLLVLPVPLVLWNHAGWLLSGRPDPWWRWLPDNWPYAAQSLYERGNVLKFVALLPAVVSPLVFPATCLGIWSSLGSIVWLRRATPRRSPAQPQDQHQDVCQFLIAAIPLLILLVHSILYATGKLASSGEVRYMLVVAPFWGLLSAKGWEWVFTLLEWRRPFMFAGIVSLLPIFANFAYRVVPLKLDDDWLRARRAAVWYQTSDISKDFPRLATAHRAINYFTGIIDLDEERAVEWRKDTLATPTPGTIVFWDPMYSIYNSDANRSVPLELLTRAGWIDVTDHVPRFGRDWRVLLSPKDVHGRDVDVRALPYSPSNP